MTRKIRMLGVICSALTFFICLLAGLWILINVGFKKDEAIWVGIGLYFVGKAFFVGPMLLMVALKYE